MPLSTLITSFSCSNYLKVRKAEGSVISLCYGLHEKAGAMFLSSQKVALLDKHLSAPLCSVKSSQDGRKASGLLILEPANKSSCGCLCMTNCGSTTLCVCTLCWMQLERRYSASEARGQRGLHTFMGPGQEHRHSEWHSVDLVHSGHLHFSWSVCWIHPAQKNVHTSSGKVVEAGITALLPICRKWGWLV